MGDNIRMDYIKPPNLPISSVNTVTGMSDHEAVFFQISMNPMKKIPSHKVYNYKSANWKPSNPAVCYFTYSKLLKYFVFEV